MIIIELIAFNYSLKPLILQFLKVEIIATLKTRLTLKFEPPFLQSAADKKLQCAHRRREFYFIALAVS